MQGEGPLIAGRYRVTRRLGSGAMGVVWLAQDLQLRRDVALKQLILQGFADAGEAAQRAIREGRIAARLHHPNAVAIHDVTTHDGHPVLVMEYFPSHSLADVLAHGPLPDDRVAHIGAQCASALATAHAAGIVHRDVKPANILVGDDGTAKITDFGISRAEGDVVVTKTGVLAGTPAYLAPEVALGRPAAAPSDVFALGGTLYAALEGRPPFGDGGNTIALLHRVASGRFDPPTRTGPVADVVAQMMRADPDTRPTMRWAHDALTAAPTTAGPPTPWPATGAPTTAEPATTVGVHSAATHDGPTTGHPAATHDQPTGDHPAGAHDGSAAAHQLRMHAGPSTGAHPAPTRVGLPVATPGTLIDTSPTRRGKWPVVVAAAIGLALVVTAVVALLPDRPSRQAAQPTTSTTSTTPAATGADLEARAAEYYRLLPRDPDAAWSMLGPAMRAQGKPEYAQSWKKVDSIRLTSAPRAERTAERTMAVLVELDRAGDDGRFHETHRLTFIQENGALHVNADEVVSSRRVGGKDDKDEDDDKGKGDKKGEDG